MAISAISVEIQPGSGVLHRGLGQTRDRMFKNGFLTITRRTPQTHPSRCRPELNERVDGCNRYALGWCDAVDRQANVQESVALTVTDSPTPIAAPNPPPVRDGLNHNE